MKLTLLLPLLSFGAAAHAVVPASGPAPAGPYSPGIGVWRISVHHGPVARRPDGSMPDTLAEQGKTNALVNVKIFADVHFHPGLRPPPGAPCLLLAGLHGAAHCAFPRSAVELGRFDRVFTAQRQARELRSTETHAAVEYR